MRVRPMAVWAFVCAAPDLMARLSTHVPDTAHGLPAAGEPLLTGFELVAGVYGPASMRLNTSGAGERYLPRYPSWIGA